MHRPLSLVANAKLGIFRHVVVGQIDAMTDWSVALKDVETVMHLVVRVHIMSDQSFDSLIEFRRADVDGSLNLTKQVGSSKRPMP